MGRYGTGHPSMWAIVQLPFLGKPNSIDPNLHISLAVYIYLIVYMYH